MSHSGVVDSKFSADIRFRGKLWLFPLRIPSPSCGFYPQGCANGRNQPELRHENKSSQLQCDFCFPDGFHGDVYLTIKMLLPGVIKMVYNLNDKQIVKLFSRIFNCNQEEMVRDLEQVSAHSSSLLISAVQPFAYGDSVMV